MPSLTRKEFSTSFSSGGGVRDGLQLGSCIQTSRYRVGNPVHMKDIDG